jgi:hypothetical protein
VCNSVIILIYDDDVFWRKVKMRWRQLKERERRRQYGRKWELGMML